MIHIQASKIYTHFAIPLLNPIFLYNFALIILFITLIFYLQIHYILFSFPIPHFLYKIIFYILTYHIIKNNIYFIILITFIQFFLCNKLILYYIILLVWLCILHKSIQNFHSIKVALLFSLVYLQFPKPLVMIQINFFKISPLFVIAITLDQFIISLK